MPTTMKLENMEVTVPPALVAQLDVTTGAEPAQIATATSEAMRKLEQFLARNDVPMVGAPRTIYTAWGAGGTRFTVAIPIARAPERMVGAEGVKIAALPETTALRFVHHGPYRDLRATYMRIDEWLRERGGITTAADWQRYAPMWEEYVNDPVTTPEADLLTYIYLTLR